MMQAKSATATAKWEFFSKHYIYGYVFTSQILVNQGISGQACFSFDVRPDEYPGMNTFAGCGVRCTTDRLLTPVKYTYCRRKTGHSTNSWGLVNKVPLCNYILYIRNMVISLINMIILDLSKQNTIRLSKQILYIFKNNYH